MKVRKRIPLKNHSTLKLGGDASYFTVVDTTEELQEAVRYARTAGLPFVVVGEGSNILFSDEGYDGLVIRNNIKGYEFYEKNGSVFVGVGAGEHWDDFVSDMVARGLYGVENLSGIPGSVGATPIQNVGAYGTEVGDTVVWVEALNVETLQTELFTNRQCHFGYRDSFFKTPEGKKFIVTEVGFRLSPKGETKIAYKDLANYFNETNIKPTLKSVRDAVISIRSQKFPDLSTVGCAGSFFKNPIVSKDIVNELQSRFKELPYYKINDDEYKIPLAWILENAVPWKGVRRDEVGVHTKQPIVLVHYGNGDAKKLKRLADDIAHSVAMETKIFITPEVSFVGKF